MEQEDILKRIETLHTNICYTKNGKLRLDLKRMYTNCTNLLTELSKEAVECRRKGKITPKYSDLLEQLELVVTNLEKYMVFAGLMDM